MAKKGSKRSPRPNAKPATPREMAKPLLLSGGNPQIAKAVGDAPVRAYIAAMPGWQRDTGRRIDAIIAGAVPGVRKAVRWNSPFYGIAGSGSDAGEETEWFLSFHCFTNYVKVAFFRGAALRPLPPGESKQKEVRYLDIHEDDAIDEHLLTNWCRQAADLARADGHPARSAAARHPDDPPKRVATAKPRSAMTSKKIKPAAPQTANAGAEQPNDWRAETLARVRSLILQADPEAVEEVIWRKPSNSMLGVPVWSHSGILCTGETYKDKIKLTFASGASLDDPAGLFNSSLEGGTRRAIDLRAGDRIDARAFKALIRAAVAFNTSGQRPKGTTRSSSRTREQPPRS